MRDPGTPISRLAPGKPPIRRLAFPDFNQNGSRKGALFFSAALTSESVSQH
jgi:hypothetical protein